MIVPRNSLEGKGRGEGGGSSHSGGGKCPSPALNRARAGGHRFPCRKFGVCFQVEWDYGLVSYHYFPSVASECGRYWVSDGSRKREK